MSTRSDNQSLARESYPEPKSKPGIVSLIREILDQPGAVHKITVERGKGIQVFRWVEKNELMEEEQSFDGTLRNSEIIEYTNAAHDLSPFEMLFDMVGIIRQTEKLFPVCWATGSGDLLGKWLRLVEQGRPFGTDEILGIPVQRLKSLPEDVLLLCGAPFEDASFLDVNVAVKAAVELIEEKNEQIVYRHVDRSRGHPPERSAAASTLEGYPRPDGREGWEPSSFIRQRLVRSS